MAATTAVQERKNVLRLLGWLRTVKRLVTPTMAIFASPQIGLVVQRYVEVLSDQGRKWSTLSKYVGAVAQGGCQPKREGGRTLGHWY